MNCLSVARNLAPVPPSTTRWSADMVTVITVATSILPFTTMALVVAISLAATRDREVVLLPTLPKQLTVSSAGVEADYLELVTRDAALVLLNRSPEGLDYWMDEILKLADPASYGRLKADLVRIVEEQRGSDVTQAFVIRSMTVDPKGLTSDVTGTLKTFVGAQVIASDERRFRFNWTYRGLRLALSGFSQLPPKDPTKDAQ